MSKRVVSLRATYLSLRAVARLGGVTPQRLRRYEAEGLIAADRVIEGEREERLYQMAVVHRVRRIRSYESIGVNLAGIEVILRLLEQRGGRSKR
jgi:DNA-binding transcriptional MerR regulator